MACEKLNESTTLFYEKMYNFLDVLKTKYTCKSYNVTYKTTICYMVSPGDLILKINNKNNIRKLLANQKDSSSVNSVFGKLRK